MNVGYPRCLPQCTDCYKALCAFRGNGATPSLAIGLPAQNRFRGEDGMTPDEALRIATRVIHPGDNGTDKRRMSRIRRFAMGQAQGYQQSTFSTKLNLHEDIAQKDRDRAENHRRRLYEQNAGGNFTPEEWRALCDRFDNRCVRCGSPGPLTIDHVIPVSRGGANSIDNLQPLCGPCNSSKCDQIADYRDRPAVPSPLHNEKRSRQSLPASSPSRDIGAKTGQRRTRNDG